MDVYICKVTHHNVMMGKELKTTQSLETNCLITMNIQGLGCGDLHQRDGPPGKSVATKLDVLSLSDH